MATIQIDPDCPQLTPAQSLAGWRLEFCIELLGEGAARIFVRAVEESSLKATELKRGVLFQRLGARFKGNACSKAWIDGRGAIGAQNDRQ